MKNDDVRRSAVRNYREGCNNLAKVVNEQLFEGCRAWYWVGGDIGGVCGFEDCDFLSAEDMARIVESGMTYDEYAEWRDANLEHEQHINLRSWMKGARHEMCGTVQPGCAPYEYKTNESCDGLTRVIDNAQDVAVMRDVLLRFINWFKTDFKTLPLILADPFADATCNSLTAAIYAYMSDISKKREQENKDKEERELRRDDKDSCLLYKSEAGSITMRLKADGSTFRDITDEMYDTYKAKNKDYDDSFHQLFEECGMTYAYGHLKEKLVRMKSLMKDEAKVKGESMRDSLLDLANYAILTIMELDKTKK